MPRVIVLGDVHGCLSELQKLVCETNYKAGEDRIIVAGDLVDRGPASPEVIRYLMDIDANAVIGNHDHKLLRRWKHMDKMTLDSSYKNPMRPSLDQEHTIGQLGAKERDWLNGLPYSIQLEEYNTVIAHAGLVPGIALERQKPEAMMMVRYIHNDTGKMLTMEMPGYKQPANSHYWAERWNGSYDVIFGHHVVGLEDIKIWDNGFGRAIGIDTGCVFGGMLTALILDKSGNHQGVQVRAEKVYNNTLGSDE